MKEFTEEEVGTPPADAFKGSGADSDDKMAPLPPAAEPPEIRQARELASRYRLPFVNLLPKDGESPIDYSLLSELPVDLMVRHQFVPLRRENGKLHITMADPTDLDGLADLASALRLSRVPHVASAVAAADVLPTAQTQQS